VAVTDNLTSLHEREEDLRARSLAVIQADAALSDHWNLVAEAMNAIYAFSHDHVHGSENELMLQYLGIRLFNAAGASIKLALSGYYQKALGQIRDLIETYFLVDYLSTNPEKIDEWRRADKKKRMQILVPASSGTISGAVTTRAAAGHLLVNHASRTTHLRADRRTPQRLHRSRARHRQAPSPAALAQQ
jgi:hypothetical protein